MTRSKIFWLILAVVAVVWIHGIFYGPDPEKPEQPALDLSKPVYTTSHAIVCPLGVLVASSFDVRADHGPEAIVDLYTSVLDLKSKEQALGCEEWRGGIRVEAVDMEQRPGGLSLVQINGTLFTAKVHLTNNPSQ
jgi:hypothetical protein